MFNKSNNKWLHRFQGFIACLVLSAFFFLVILPFLSQPGPGEPTAVTENPPEGKPAVVVTSSGTLSGKIDIPPRPTPTAQNQGDLNPGGISSEDSVPNQNPGQKTGILALVVGDKYSASVTGSLHSIYVSSQTGRQIGEGVHPITGVTEITIGENSLIPVTTIQNDFTFTVDVQEPPPLRDHFGGMLGTNSKFLTEGTRWGSLYYQHDFRLNKYIAAPVRIDYFTGNEYWIRAGMQIDCNIFGRR